MVLTMVRFLPKKWREKTRHSRTDDDGKETNVFERMSMLNSSSTLEDIELLRHTTILSTISSLQVKEEYYSYSFPSIPVTPIICSMASHGKTSKGNREDVEEVSHKTSFANKFSSLSVLCHKTSMKKVTHPFSFLMMAWQ